MWNIGQFPHTFIFVIEPLEDIANRIKKRLFDILFSLLIIVFVLTWLIPILGSTDQTEFTGTRFFQTGKVREK